MSGIPASKSATSGAGLPGSWAASLLAGACAVLLFAGPATAQFVSDDTAALDQAAAADVNEVPQVTSGSEEPSRFYLPPLPYYQELTSQTGLRLFFPFYFEWWDDAAREHNLGVLPFYWQYRGPDELHETDVVLGLYWRYRRPERFTDVFGPLYVSRTADGYDVGLPPLFAVGGDATSDYQILGLYFWRFASETGSFTLAPPFYYYREGAKLRYGLPPLLFGGEDGHEGYSVFFPLFWQFYDDQLGTNTTVVPPLFVDIAEDGSWTAGVAPLLFFGGGDDSSHFTFVPLLHYAHDGDSTRVITPLAWYAGSSDSEGWGALLYHQWDEGPEWFRTFAPVWWAWGNEETGERNDLVLNVYHGSDPVSSDWVAFPFWWDFHDLERNRTFGFMPLFMHDTSLYEDRHTTWVAPTFQYSEWPQTGAEPPGWSFNMHPLIYIGTSGEDHHEVVFPIWWNFYDEESRTTLALPLFLDLEDYAEKSRFWTFFPLVWHDEDPEGSFTLAVNTIYTTTVNDDGSEGWHFHFIPLFDFGRERPEDIDWSILYGLVGYERRGEFERMKLFWIPFGI